MCNVMTTEKKSDGVCFLDYINQSPSTHVELFVEGLGWLILLKESIEIVSDNWFTSTKFIASQYKLVEGTEDIIELKNVYRVNASHIENDNNVKYNLHYETLNINAKKIIAYH